MAEVNIWPRWCLMRLDDIFIFDDAWPECHFNDGEMIMLRAGLINLVSNLPDTPLRRAIKGILEKLEREMELEFGVGRFAPEIDMEV